LIQNAGWSPARVLPGIILLLCLGCAEVASPPGGEIDRSGPFLIGSIPENGSTDVPINNKVTFFFSEYIKQPASVKALYISPRQDKEPKIKWKSDRIQITFTDSFATDQTYIISVASGITDLRNNQMDSSLIVAFSTGPSIDSGKVSGIISKSGTPLGNYMIGLYDVTTFNDSTVYDSIFPDYVTQSRKDGGFAFDYLPEQEYRLIGFQDKNRDERFNPEREEFALPDRKIDVGGDLPIDSLLLRATKQDTLLPEVISIGYIADKLVKLRLTKLIKTDLLRKSLFNAMLQSVEDSSIIIKCTGFLEFDKDQVSSFNFYFGDVKEGIYRFRLTYDYDKPELVYEELEVKLIKDEKAPEIVSFYPGGKPVFIDKADIRVVISEPLDTNKLTEETFTFWDTDNNRLPLTYEWGNPFYLNFLTEELQPGSSYYLKITEFDISDIAGNVLGDTLREYSFSILDDDSLGSVSGRIVVNLPNRQTDPVYLFFTKIENKQVFDQHVESHEFKINLPAGKYLLSGFIDTGW